MAAREAQTGEPDRELGRSACVSNNPIRRRYHGIVRLAISKDGEVPNAPGQILLPTRRLVDQVLAKLSRAGSMPSTVRRDLRPEKFQMCILADAST
ncbi:hypothetical protein VTN00DRAFT_6436 [Thermoascus crustaceus]|uniref:uncharacterized protein n=1 Tax=Thermoascus crustaceus TaxID=5088 RepID=UPI0037434402